MGRRGRAVGERVQRDEGGYTGAEAAALPPRPAAAKLRRQRPPPGTLTRAAGARRAAGRRAAALPQQQQQVEVAWGGAGVAEGRVAVGTVCEQSGSEKRGDMAEGHSQLRPMQASCITHPGSRPAGSASHRRPLGPRPARVARERCVGGSVGCAARPVRSAPTWPQACLSGEWDAGWGSLARKPRSSWRRQLQATTRPASAAASLLALLAAPPMPLPPGLASPPTAACQARVAPHPPQPAKRASPPTRPP